MNNTDYKSLKACHSKGLKNKPRTVNGNFVDNTNTVSAKHKPRGAARVTNSSPGDGCEATALAGYKPNYVPNFINSDCCWPAVNNAERTSNEGSHCQHRPDVILSVLFCELSLHPLRRIEKH